VTDRTVGSAGAPSPSVSAFAPAALDTVENNRQEPLSLFTLSRDALRTRAEGGAASLLGNTEEKPPSLLGSYLSRKTGAMYTLSPLDQLLQLSGPEPTFNHRHILELQVIDRVKGGGSCWVGLSKT
jgi:hypothetical protein